MDNSNYKAGFVAIIGKPNAGKSTLMNLLLGEQLAITNPKAQTTRHGLHGIVSEKHFQIIYTDTPGIIKPAYPLQTAMMKAVTTACVSADVIIWLVNVKELKDAASLLNENPVYDKPTLLVLNKMDLVSPAQLDQVMADLLHHNSNLHLLPISATKRINIAQLLEKIIAWLPVHPPYYPAHTLTDRPERFFVQEIIREKILGQYEQEIPYSVEVAIDSFKEMENLIKIQAIIYVERQTQKGILIGAKGSGLNQLGINARIALEQFFQKKIFLGLHVKLAQNWRKNKLLLEKFGYPSIAEKKV
ncbi:MAG: GTPase Era [Amoebophilaceae bacterium]|nr:GTPase Era [Amoebophilaceae bacterium]